MPKRKRILIDSEDGEEMDSEEDEEEVFIFVKFSLIF